MFVTIKFSNLNVENQDYTQNGMIPKQIVVYNKTDLK